MSDAALIEEPEALPFLPEPPALGERDRDLLGRSNSPIRKRLDELFEEVREGFEGQSQRADDQQDYWACYNCTLDGNQFYNGNATIYWPIIHDAIEARATRFVNQEFPQTGRCVEAVASDGSTVASLVALLDHYIRAAKFKTSVAKPLCRNGDIEGQYNLYVDWADFERVLVSRETHGPIDPMTGVEGPGEGFEDISEETVMEGRPIFEVLHDSDVLVLPVSADSVEEALACGGSVTIVRRWTKAKIEQMADAGVIRREEATKLIGEMSDMERNGRNVERALTEHVGIQRKGREATVWETWSMLPLGPKGYDSKGQPRLCRMFFGPEKVALGCKRNPYWNDRCPLLSEPVQKVSGVFKGPSLIAPVSTIQYEANDAVNQGADAAAYSALPIVRRDPETASGPMVLNLAAIWEAPAGAVEIMQFPDLTPRAAIRVEAAMRQIFQTLGVNPAMLPQQSGEGKLNQAEVALQQSVDLLTTAEAVSVLEEGIFTPAMEWAVDLDYQFRSDPLTVRMFGEMGREAIMEEVAPLQNRRGFTFLWRGGDQVRQNAMMMQQGTAWLNVLRPMRPELQAEGLALHLGPIVEAGTKNIFGPVLGARTITDQREQLTLATELEVEMMLDGFQTVPHPLDNDQEKITAFRQAMVETGDPHMTIRARIAAQLQQMQAKAMAMQQQQMQQQLQSGPQSGMRGSPQPGAAPAGPRLVKGPPGMIAQDQLPRAGAMVPPRRA